VLLIDEVLGTGDAVFRAKSKQRIIDLTGAAKGIVLVTHDMSWVTEFCNRALLLDHGHVIMEGPPADVVALHEERSEKARIEREEELQRRMQAVVPKPTPKPG
jgi:ABC-type polysaccharide/polyol phosphate transport system ATPase subunit